MAIRSPSTLGSGLSAFVDAYLRADEARRRDADEGRRASLFELQLEEALRQADLRQQIPAAIAAHGTTPLETVTTVPERVGVPAGFDAGGLDFSGGEPAAAFAPGAGVLQAVAPRAAVTESARTTAGVARHMGPELYGAALRGGILGELNKQAGIITPDEFEKRQHFSKAKEEFKDALEETSQFQLAGDSLRATVHEKKATERFAEMLFATGNPRASDYMRRARELNDTVVKLTTDEQARVRLDGEMKVIAGLSAKLTSARRDGDEVAAVDIAVEIMTTFSTSISPEMRKTGMGFVAKLAEGALGDTFKDQDIQVFLRGLGAVQAQAASPEGGGKILDGPDALKALATADPDAFGRGWAKVMTAKEISASFKEALWGEDAKKWPTTDIQLATQTALSENRAAGKPTDLKAQKPEFWGRVGQLVDQRRAVESERRDKRREGDVERRTQRDLQLNIRELQRSIGNLDRELRHSEASGSGVSPETIADMMARREEYQRRLTVAQDEMDRRRPELVPDPTKVPAPPTPEQTQAEVESRFAGFTDKASRQSSSLRRKAVRDALVKAGHPPAQVDAALVRTRARQITGAAKAAGKTLTLDQLDAQLAKEGYEAQTPLPASASKEPAAVR